MMAFCPKCGERDKLAPHTEYWNSDTDQATGLIKSFHRGPHTEGQRLTGKTECRVCNTVFLAQDNR